MAEIALSKEEELTALEVHAFKTAFRSAVARYANEIYAVYGFNEEVKSLEDKALLEISTEHKIQGFTHFTLTPKGEAIRNLLS